MKVVFYDRNEQIIGMFGNGGGGLQLKTFCDATKALLAAVINSGEIPENLRGSFGQLGRLLETIKHNLPEDKK